jgi:hypothetical protein
MEVPRAKAGKQMTFCSRERVGCEEMCPEFLVLFVSWLAGSSPF